MKQLIVFVFAATISGCGPRAELPQVPSSGNSHSLPSEAQPLHHVDLRMILGRWAMAVVDEHASIAYVDDPTSMDAIVIDIIEDKSVIDALPLTSEMRRRMEMSRQYVIGRYETKRLECREPIIAQRFILMSDDSSRITKVIYNNDPPRSNSWRMAAEAQLVPVESIDKKIIASITIDHGVSGPKVFFEKRLD